MSGKHEGWRLKEPFRLSPPVNQPFTQAKYSEKMVRQVELKNKKSSGFVLNILSGGGMLSNMIKQHVRSHA